MDTDGHGWLCFRVFGVFRGRTKIRVDRCLSVVKNCG